jgi:hypothetical protein
MSYWNLVELVVPMTSRALDERASDQSHTGATVIPYHVRTRSLEKLSLSAMFDPPIEIQSM